MEKAPIGICTFCSKKQSAIGKDGLWIAYDSSIKWICFDCKDKRNIRSYPVACEWCSYNDVKWHQGHTYDCQRCNMLGIKH